MDSTMESATTETKTYKEGQLIKGKDFIRLESPLVLPSKNTPLLTEAQDFVGAINELFGQGTGANGAFRAVWDDNAGTLAIVVQEGNKYADYQFGYGYTDYSDEITTQTVVGEETVKTTRSFSKRIITSLLDASGEVLLVTDYNTDNGLILGYTDGSGEVVHTAEWRSEYEPVVTQSPGASSAAIAWCIARNMEQSKNLEQQKKAYRKGVTDYGKDVTEVFTEPLDNGFNLVPEEGGTIIDLEKGVYVKTSEITVDGVTGIFQLRIYLDGYTSTFFDNVDKNRVVVELTGNGISQSYTFENQYWEGTTGGVNDYYMTSAVLDKSYGIDGTYYWEYDSGYRSRDWQFFGNYAAALKAGEYISSLPFDETN